MPDITAFESEWYEDSVALKLQLLGFRLPVPEPFDSGPALDPTKFLNAVNRQTELHRQIEERTVFTQKHYESLAKTIREQRDGVQSDLGLSSDERANLLAGISMVTIGLVELFRKDNPRFKDLVFIGVAHGDLAQAASQESETANG